MTRYKPNTLKPFAQPAYQPSTATDVSLRRRRPPGGSSHYDPIARTPTDPTETITLDPAPPTEPYRNGLVKRSAYPPCPGCREPIITIWTYGPNHHNADPCGCPLSDDDVMHLVASR